MLVREIIIESRKRNELIDITDKIEEIISQNKLNNGVCFLFCPHTTAGITINENADPSVGEDLLKSLDKIIPKMDFKHTEGNSDAHIKASLIGASKTVFVENGNLRLGTWQGVFFCEFDGPRHRKVYLRILDLGE